MRRCLALTLCLFLLASFAVGCAEAQKTTRKLPLPEPKAEKPKSERIIVTRVVDGDTIEVSIDGKTEEIRLIGIDAPARGRPFFQESTNKAKELLEGKEVQLVKDASERDEYGRLLRYIFEGSTFVNAELVRQGYANVYTYPPDIKYSELFVRMEREARENNRGLWTQAAPGPTPPQSSPQSQPQAKGTYVGSKNSNKYHYPNCVWAQKIYPQNQVWFSSKEDAQAKGYVACKVCRPPGYAVAGESVTSPQPAPAPAPPTRPAPPPQVQEPAPETLPIEATVYITNTGEKYHMAGCRYLSKSDIPISLSEAKARGYTPCSVCNPPQ